MVTAAIAALVGGGSRVVRPGAIARATEGVLFLDESRATYIQRSADLTFGVSQAVDTRGSTRTVVVRTAPLRKSIYGLIWG